MRRITFEAAGTTITAAVADDADAAGSDPRIVVALDAEELAVAHRHDAFGLEQTIPGGPPVPGVDPAQPVLLELRLADEPAALLARSLRSRAALTDRLVALTADDEPDLLRQADAWRVTAVRQPHRGMDLQTMFALTPEPEPADPDDVVADVVRAVVASQPGAEQLGPATWRVPTEVDEQPFSTFATVRARQILVFASRSEPVPPGRRAAVNELLGDLNPELTLAWFECQRSTGVVSCRTALDTGGVEVTDRLVRNLLGAAVATMGRFLPAIDAVATGEMDASDFLDDDEEEVDHLDLGTASDTDIASWLDRFAATASQEEAGP